MDRILQGKRNVQFDSIYVSIYAFIFLSFFFAIIQNGFCSHDESEYFLVSVIPIIIRIILKRRLNKTLSSCVDQVHSMKQVLLFAVETIAQKMEEHVEVRSIYFVC